MNEGGLGGDNFKYMPEERLDEVKKTMSERMKEDWDSLTKEEKQKRIDNVHKWQSGTTTEQLEEYYKLLSRRNKENWDSLTKEEKQKRIDNCHKWQSEMGEDEKKEHYRKLGCKYLEWRQSLTKQEKEELNQIHSKGIKRYWDNLNEEELVERKRATSKSVRIHWDSLTEEERKERNKNSGKRKTYSVISPNGMIFETKNLLEFCRENNLSRNVMYDISKSGKLHKEWRCDIISD